VFLTRSRGEPDFSDKWGCPYWLLIDGDDEVGWSRWLLSSYRKLPIGKVELIWNDSNQLTLGDIVLFEERDRERGLGSMLLQRVIAFGRGRGMQRIVGEVVPEREENREQLYSWYRSHGFTITLQHNKRGELTLHLEMDL
jgi:GNAT superfamily N-acetyltransferase